MKVGPFAPARGPAIASLPPDYQKIVPPDENFDLNHGPRVSRMQSDLLANT